MIAKALDYDLSEENCVLFFGYVDFTILVVLSICTYYNVTVTLYNISMLVTLFKQ